MACASADGQETRVDLKYPVPVLPLEGWATASVSAQKRVVNDSKFEVTSAMRHGRMPTEYTRGETLKDNYPHNYFVNFHLQNLRQNNSPLTVKLGENRTSNPAGLRIGRSVVGLTSTRGTVVARMADLEAIMDSPQGTWQWGNQLPTSVEIIEHTDAAMLPDSWMGYDLLQAMVIEDFSYSYLSRAQEDAIVQWVENGGTILVSPGRGGMALRSTLLRRLVEFKMEGTETVTNPPGLSGFGPKKVTRWNVRVSQGRIGPLAQVAACGAGKVVIFKYDILREPFSQWPGLKNHLQRTCLIPVKGQRRVSFPLHWSPREEKLPKAPTVALILGLYLLMVGPLNYFVLRRTKRLVLMPFTIGGTALAFTAAIIIFGYISRGMATELREFTVVRTSPRRTTAFAITQKGIYASANRAFAMSFGDSTALRKMSRQERGWRSSESPLEVFDTGRGTLNAKFTSLMWDVFAIEARGPLKEFGNLRVERDGSAITVFNSTGVDLENCWVRLRGAWYSTGKLPKLGTTTNPRKAGRPPSDILGLLPDIGRGVAVVRKAAKGSVPARLRTSPLADTGKGVVVVGKAARGSEPAIPYEFTKGGARTVQSDTYILGGMQ